MRAWGSLADRAEKGGAYHDDRSRSPPQYRRKGKGKGKGKYEERGQPPPAHGYGSYPPPGYGYPPPGHYPPPVAPPAYDGSAKGTWSTWDVYFGKGSAPPAYDGVAQPGKGPTDALSAYMMQQAAQPPMMPPSMLGYGMPAPIGYGKGGPHLPSFLGGEAAGGRPPKGTVKGKGRGKNKDGKGGDQNDKPVPTEAALDSQLDKYFSGEGSNGNNREKANARVARFSQGQGKNQKDQKEPASEATLDDQLSAYMSKKDDKEGGDE